LLLVEVHSLLLGH
jgi:hypothetical protein